MKKMKDMTLEEFEAVVVDWFKKTPSWETKMKNLKRR